MFGIAQVGAHEGVAVDDPRGRRVQGRHALQLRFHGASLRRAHAHDIGDAVGVRLLPDRLQVLQLRGIVGDDQLAAAPVRHAALGAEGVKTLPTLDARARLERAFRVIDAGVDDFGIARARVRADRVFGFQHDHLAAGERELARDGEAHDARADHHGVHSFQVRIGF